MIDAKALVEAGEKLNVNTAELRTLKNAVRMAKNWAAQVKKCDFEGSDTSVSTVKELISDHREMLIEMPDELAKLKSATQCYCICRRQYEGFMIGCDECDEWYHGPCIGISESRADRFDKYICIRCSVKNVFKASANQGVALIKKWTGRRDLKKARQVEYQKHQRKVRKESKDAAKFEKDVEALKEKLKAITDPVSGENGAIALPENNKATPSKTTEDDAVPSKAANVCPPEGVVVSNSDAQVGGPGDINVCEKPSQGAVAMEVETSSDGKCGVASADVSTKQELADPTATTADCSTLGNIASAETKIFPCADTAVSSQAVPLVVIPVEESTKDDAPGSSKMDASSSVKEAVTAETATAVFPPEKTSNKKETGDNKVEKATPTSEQPQKPPCALSAQSLERKLEKATASLEEAQRRLRVLSAQSVERKLLETMENENSAALLKWCIRVRSLVLLPSISERAVCAYPRELGAMSSPMLSVMNDAAILGIQDLPDVKAMQNNFKCMSWSMHTLRIICRKPTYRELTEIISLADGLALPEEKALRTMKLMVQKANQLKAKVNKALSPRPGLVKSLNVDSLKELVHSADELAVKVIESHRLKVAIKDKGARHCFCKGPSDGRFMVRCDKCEIWFHGTCVGVTKDSLDSSKKWLCSDCSGNGLPSVPEAPPFDFTIDPEDEKTILCAEPHDFSDHAPDPKRLWPPFPFLFGSEKAVEMLGVDCSALPDQVLTLDSSEKSDEVQGTIERTQSKPMKALNPQHTDGTTLSVAPKQHALHLVKSDSETKVVTKSLTSADMPSPVNTCVQSNDSIVATRDGSTDRSKEGNPISDSTNEDMRVVQSSETRSENILQSETLCDAEKSHIPSGECLEQSAEALGNTLPVSIPSVKGEILGAFSTNAPAEGTLGNLESFMNETEGVPKGTGGNSEPIVNSCPAATKIALPVDPAAAAQEETTKMDIDTEKMRQESETEINQPSLSRTDDDCTSKDEESKKMEVDTIVKKSDEIKELRDPAKASESGPAILPGMSEKLGDNLPKTVSGTELEPSTVEPIVSVNDDQDTRAMAAKSTVGEVPVEVHHVEIAHDSFTKESPLSEAASSKLTVESVASTVQPIAVDGVVVKASVKLVDTNPEAVADTKPTEMDTGESQNESAIPAELAAPETTSPSFDMEAPNMDANHEAPSVHNVSGESSTEASTVSTEAAPQAEGSFPKTDRRHTNTSTTHVTAPPDLKK